MEIQNYVKLIFRNKWETACQPSCNNCKILPFKDWWPIQRLWRQLDKSKKAWKGFKGPPPTCTRPWGSRGSASVWIWEPQRRPQEQVRRPRQLLQRPHPPNPTQHSQQLEVRKFDLALFCPFTMLQKLPNCEVKASLSWNLVILLPLRFCVKSNFVNANGQKCHFWQIQGFWI